MKKTTVVILCVCALLGALAATATAASEHDEHHPAEQATMSKGGGMDSGGMMMPGMMGQTQGMMMSEMMGKGQEMMAGGIPCPLPHASKSMLNRVADWNFYLDRSAELELSEEQLEKLRSIRGAFLRDNIRSGADLKIARLDLDELLGSDWSLKDAEGAVRRIETLEGDLKVRLLKALAEARGVLTAEQLKKAESAKGEISLEELF